VQLRDLDPSTLPPALTAETAAELLGMHPNALRRLVRQGRAPVMPLYVGKHLRFPTSRVLEVLGIARETAPATPGTGAESENPTETNDGVRDGSCHTPGT